MSATIDRRVLLRSAANFRDLGGLPAAEGTVVRGQVFRSASLARLDNDDTQKIIELDISTVYDLRTALERETDPDRLPESARAIALDVLADGTGGVAQAVGRIRNSPETVNDLLSRGKISHMLEQSYREFVDLPSAQLAYRNFFLDLASVTRQGAALFHCTAGKDRTGWAAASLLLLLGTDDATVRADYLQTNDDFLPTLQPLFESAAEKGVDIELLREAMSVKESYLDISLDRVSTRYGTIENYFIRGLNIDTATIDLLRKRFIN